MSNTLAASFKITGNGSLTPASNNFSKRSSGFQLSGTGNLTGLGIDLSDGTGNNQANEMYVARSTVTASGNLDLDLAGSLTNALGETITFTKIKVIYIAIVSPDGTKKVAIGPAGISNPFIGPWTGGQGATVYQDVYTVFFITNPVGGWTVTASTGDKFRITNPGGSDLEVDIILIGTK